MAGRYSLEGVDEIVFLDIVATLYGRNNTLALVERTACNTLLPLTVGGGVNWQSHVYTIASGPNGGTAPGNVRAAIAAARGAT